MKISKNIIFLFVIITGFISCEEDKVTEKRAIAEITPKNDSEILGNVSFTEINGIVHMIANISGLTEGNHAIHIHEKGDCSEDDGSSAGGHWNPTNENHGVWNQGKFHRGDIGNIVANSAGKASMKRETDLWCVNCKDETKNIIGKAIIIHIGPDDFSSQPSGAAGSRIGCGEIVLE